MNSIAGPAVRRTFSTLVALALAVATSSCGDSGGDGASSATEAVASSAPVATEVAATEPAATDPAATAATEPAGTEPAGTEPAGTEPVGTVGGAERPDPTTGDTAATTTAPDAPTTTVAPPTTAPPTTAPPAPATTAAPIVIGGLTLASCIASEMFGEGMTQPRSEVALYQYTLRNMGYDPGEIDGYFGALTMEAAAYEVIDHTTDNAGLFVDEGVIYKDVFIRLGLAC